MSGITDPDHEGDELAHDTRGLGADGLAENTDGIAVVNTNDLRAGLGKIVDDVSAYYLPGLLLDELEGRREIPGRITVRLETEGCRRSSRGAGMSRDGRDRRRRSDWCAKPARRAQPKRHTRKRAPGSAHAHRRGSQTSRRNGAVSGSDLLVVAEIAVGTKSPNGTMERRRHRQGRGDRTPNGDSTGTGDGDASIPAHEARSFRPAAQWRRRVPGASASRSRAAPGTLDVHPSTSPP